MLHRLLFLIMCCAGWLVPFTGQASHAQGGELTYEYIGTPANPDRYRVSCRFFRDCSGIAAPTSLTVNARVGGCAGTNPMNRTALLTRGVLTSGSPYCANMPGGPSQCSAFSFSNYEAALYSGEIDLPPLAEWVLSVEESARPALANIPGHPNLRLEATLNNLITLTGGPTGTRTITNTSPQYNAQDIPIPFVCVGQRTTLSFFALEPDGDSLVYSMEAPLDRCGVPTTYSSIVSSGGVIPAPGSSPANPCVVTLPSTLPTTYSPAYPILSLNITGSCPTKTSTSYFNFYPTMGYFTFTPAQYFNTPTSSGDNKYAIVGKVTEYRRISGRYYKIGSIRRDMLVVVIDCPTNSVPNAPAGHPITSGAGTVVDSTVVEAPVGIYSEYSIAFTDPNPNDLLTVTYVEPTDPLWPDMYLDPNNPTVRPFMVQANGTPAPVGRLRLRPHSSTLGMVFRIPLRVEDNACPIKGVQNRMLIIRIVPRTVTNSRDKIKSASLLAHPNPFAREVTFTLPQPATRTAQVVEVYNQLGQVVDRLTVQPASAAQLSVTWQPAAALPAGVYTARLAGGGQAVRVMRVQP